MPGSRLVQSTVLVLGLTACGPPDIAEHRFRGSTMGTSYSVKVVASLTEEQQQAVQAAIDEQLDLVNSRMSTYLVESELSRLNAWQEDGLFEVSPETLEVLLEAQRVAQLSDGAFDITVGPLVDAWGFGPGERPVEPPSEEALRALLRTVGWSQLEIQQESSSVRKKKVGLQCDLSALAKGYAVDRVSESLTGLGYGRHMVEVGGEVRARGEKTTGGGWRIGIEKPAPEKRELYRVIALEDLSMATSGDYRNFYDVDGKLISHTIDPRTGRPVEHDLAAVSVIDESCMRADALATALFVLGENEGYDLAVELDLAALFQVRDGVGGFLRNPTPAFDDLFGPALVRIHGERLLAELR